MAAIDRFSNEFSSDASASCMLIGNLIDFSIPMERPIERKIEVVPYRRQPSQFDVVVCKYCGRNQAFPESGECRACGASLDYYDR